MENKYVSPANNVIKYSSDFGLSMYSDRSIILQNNLSLL